MPYVYKKKTWGPLPANAELVSRETLEGESELIATWTDDKGRIQEAEAKWDHKTDTVKIVTGKSRKWIAVYDTPHGRKSKTAYVDKQASQRMAEDLEIREARIAEGLLDPIDEEVRRPIGEHLEDYMASRIGRGNSKATEQQVRRRIERVITGTRASRLLDLDATEIEKFFTANQIRDLNRNDYISNLQEFMKWAIDHGRLAKTPIASLTKTPRKKISPKHPRRALTVEEIDRLLDATRKRPLIEAMTVRTGKNKGKPIANVRGSVRAKCEQVGRQRRTAYLVALWTGLRRSELRALQWRDVHLEGDVPHIQLRAATTKSRRADVLTLHPQIADELSVMKPHDVDPTERVLPEVPSMAVLKKDLKLAGIEYGDAEIGYVDLHSMRMTLNTLMARAGISPRVRQKHMRHTDPRLTELTYLDDRQLPVNDQLGQLPALNAPSREPSHSAQSEPSKSRAAENAAHMLRDSGGPGREESDSDISRHKTNGITFTLEDAENMTYVAECGGLRHRLTLNGEALREMLEKRVKGFEPSTFTLAT